MQSVRLAFLAILITLGMPIFTAKPAAVRAQAAAASEPSPQWDGVWRCQTDGQPNFDIVISQEGRQIAGSILFYLHMRKDEHSPWTVSASGPGEPMFNMELGGDTLRFEVSHRRAHPPRTLHDPPLHFAIRMVSPGKAELLNSAEGASPNFELIRSDY